MWLVDVSRLIESMNSATATGIERVEMAYAKHFLQRAESDDVRFTVTLPSLTAIFDSQQIAPLLQNIACRWFNDGTDVRSDPVYARLSALLSQKPGGRARQAFRIGNPEGQMPRARNVLSQALLRARLVANRLSGKHITEFRRNGARFVHVSQFRLNRTRRFRWLKEARINSLFFLHDLIPVTHPEYCRPGEDERHAQRVTTMLDHASIIIANSNFTKKSLEHFCGLQRRPMPRCEVVGLGIDPIFLAPPRAKDATAAVPYFVTVGTIEPRKNLAFLLHVWDRWIRSTDEPRARLVIVGRRGWENENVLDLLERSPGLSSTVIEVNSLSDGGLAQLLRNAAALLAPSLVEGFGLPIIEAMALGVPVVASDIEAFREVGDDLIDFADPIDGKEWMRLLDEFSSSDSQHRRRRVAGLAEFRPISWSAHTQRAEQIWLQGSVLT